MSAAIDTMPDASASGMTIAACLSRAIADFNAADAKSAAMNAGPPTGERLAAKREAAARERELSSLEDYILDSPIRDFDDALLRVLIVSGHLRDCGTGDLKACWFDRLNAALDRATRFIADQKAEWRRPALRALMGYYLAQYGASLA